MKVLPVSQNNYYQPKFRAYTPKEICADLCKGACCNHGTAMGANLKKIADKLCASYRTIADELKSTILIKAPIVKWMVNSPYPEVNSLNELANTYIDAISRETNPEKVKALQQELDKINEKLADWTYGSEPFVAVTNPEIQDQSFFEVAANETNICMFKDHEKTNLCTIYDGVKDETGKITQRPSPCFKFGSDELPCPWHHPEKYVELYHKTKAMLQKNGYFGLPMERIQQYIAGQYNLNETFNEKIWQPYLKTLEKKP